MASYEYTDIDEYGDYIVDRAKTRLLYKSNTTDKKELNTILLALFNDAYNIVKAWRHLKTDDEFLSQKWDTQLTEYVISAYQRMGDETLASSNINGVNRSYKISPEAKLKSSIPQTM